MIDEIGVLHYTIEQLQKENAELKDQLALASESIKIVTEEPHWSRFQEQSLVDGDDCTNVSEGDVEVQWSDADPMLIKEESDRTFEEYVRTKLALIELTADKILQEVTK